MQGSATLSMAYAGALFADACLRALNGEPDVEEYAYVESNVVPELSFFSTKVKLGPEGACQLCMYFLQMCTPLPCNSTSTKLLWPSSPSQFSADQKGSMQP